jgi:hypothetical protein
MHRRLLPTTALTVLALTALGSAAGCGSTASKAVDKVTNAVSSAASQAAASASSAASQALNSAKDAVTATGDVKTGPVSTDADGKAISTLTVTNPTADQHTYTISVSFEDSKGTLLDATVVTVDNVAGHGSATATAKSNRTLSNAAQVKVTAAVRH